MATVNDKTVDGVRRTLYGTAPPNTSMCLSIQHIYHMKTPEIEAAISRLYGVQLIQSVKLMIHRFCKKEFDYDLEKVYPNGRWTKAREPIIRIK